MNAVLAVAVGGALGSVGRYLVVDAMARALGVAFPWGTLVVNTLGGVAIGVLAAVFLARPEYGDWRPLLITGVLGGFTTFSAFSLDAFGLAQRGQWASAAAYVAASVALSLIGTAAGWRLARAWLA
ncbi:MAG: fluoride efflux transporter CrcB [Rhodospirillales bacterium]|nr:fluoride efflux transporter CrcB [Rhodospirillales bacterium]QQS11785.1 MAG: fluoride efflux transporter CrcB [Rhodospirillales bacterium]